MNRQPAIRTWVHKFGQACCGIGSAVRQERSFMIHLPAGMGVVLWAWWLQLDVLRLAVLVICMGLVLSAELFNSSLERIARAITSSNDPQIKQSLDMAAGAVLTVSGFAAVVGILLLVIPTWQWAFGA